MCGNLINSTQKGEVSPMLRSVVKWKFVLHQLMLRRVKTKPVEFSPSNRNVPEKTLIQINVISTGAYEKERTEISLQQTKISVRHEILTVSDLLSCRPLTKRLQKLKLEQRIVSHVLRTVFTNSRLFFRKKS